MPPDHQELTTQVVDLQQRLDRLEWGLARRISPIEPSWQRPWWYEPTVQIALRETVELGDLVFDVGANIGGISALMARLVGPFGHVIAFEASRRVLPELHASLSYSNAFNVTVVNAAVTATTGDWLNFYFAEYGSQADSLRGSGEPSAVVRSLSLDDYVAAIGRAPAVVKLDIEGAELPALQGFVRTLEQEKPALIVEISSRDCELGAFLASHGYTQARDLGTLQPFESRPDSEDHVRNVLFSHPQGRGAGAFSDVAPMLVATIGMDDFSFAPSIARPGELEGVFVTPILDRGVYLLVIELTEQAAAVAECGDIAMFGDEDVHLQHIQPPRDLARGHTQLPFMVRRPGGSNLALRRLDEHVWRGVIAGMKIYRMLSRLGRGDGVADA